MNKAPVLSKEQLIEVIYMAIETPDRYNDEGWKNKQRFNAVSKAQNDADHKHYQGIIREIFEEIEGNCSYTREAGHPIINLDSDWWQSLKSKYQEILDNENKTTQD